MGLVKEEFRTSVENLLGDGQPGTQGACAPGGGVPQDRVRPAFRAVPERRDKPEAEGDCGDDWGRKRVEGDIAGAPPHSNPIQEIQGLRAETQTAVKLQILKL